MLLDDSATSGVPRSDPPDSGGGVITCEACESKLHKSGDVKKKSERLRGLEKLDEVNGGLRQENSRLAAENEELKTKIAGLEVGAPPRADDLPAPEPTKHLHLTAE